MVGFSDGVWWDIKCISPMTIIVPDILHNIYVSIFKHFKDCISSFLTHHSRIDKFNQLWPMMPSYRGFARFNKRYSEVTKYRVKEIAVVWWRVLE